MANQPEVSNFDIGVYQLEITDSNEAGAGGVLNAPLLALANRTKWLKDKTVAIDAVDLQQTTDITALLKHMPKNRGFFTGLNVGVSTGALTVGGNITAAVASTGTSESFILVTMQHSMTTTNYFVRASIESIGTIGLDNDIQSCVVKKTSATQFNVSLREIAGSAQNLKIHLEVISLD